MSHCCDDNFPYSYRLARDLAAQGRIVKTQVGDAAVQARQRLTPLVEAAVDRAKPVVDRAKPVVDEAIAKVSDVVSADLMPRLADLRQQATPLIDDAAKRSRLAVSALKGDLVAEPAPKRGHPVWKAIGVAAIVAIIGYLVKVLLEARNDGWAMQDEVFDDVVVTEDTEDPQRYGEGSYIGSEPPEGYVIKGNDRSMKYHVPTAIGYERCVTEIWFNSPEAAESAGFTRALR